MKNPPIVTTRDRNLSLWETFAESLLKATHPNMNIADIRQLPFMQAVYSHVLQTQGRQLPNITPEVSALAEKSKAFYEMASRSTAPTTPELVADADAYDDDHDIRTYSDEDAMWYVVAALWWSYMNGKQLEEMPWYEKIFAKMFESNPVGNALVGLQWLAQSSDKEIQEKFITYRQWNSNSGKQKFSIIDWVLPNDAKVVMLGDWGTNNPDCKALLKAIWGQEDPQAFVHLGDIYYTGTQQECDDNFYNIFIEVAQELGKEMVPVFTIPGNHEYYDFGKGFYYLIDKMNTGGQQQDASYFCLRTQDGQWQFLGMDTGQDDNNPYVTSLSPFAPKLFGDRSDDGELAWHEDKLANFNGQTILMSHHQLFTRDAGNKIDSDVEPYFNRFLYGYFSPYFNKIAA